MIRVAALMMGEGVRRAAARGWRLGPVARRHADGVLWRVAAMALMLNLLTVPQAFHSAPLAIGKAYARIFWRTRAVGQWADIATAILIGPLGVLGAALWFSHRNGAVVAARSGRSIGRQFADQLRLGATTGLPPPWYYIFELYEPGAMARARCYLTRGQTKYGAYPILAAARGSCSPLSDKEQFARFCSEHELAAAPVLCSVRDGACHGQVRAAVELPRVDLFVKPVTGRGGRGAERWDHVGGGLYRPVEGRQLSAAQLMERLRKMSRRQPYLVQKRLLNAPAIRDLSNGALSTLRILSCLDEREQPEIVGAVLRMAVGRNVTVDNVHAGGLAAAVDLESGRLSRATDIGLNAHAGWIDHHPDTGGQIAGRLLPVWNDVIALVRQAHLAFRDWIVVGWDVAILADGPCLVEGNSGPDVDLIQRPLRTAFGCARLGELLAFHLAAADRGAGRGLSGSPNGRQPSPPFDLQRSAAKSSLAWRGRLRARGALNDPLGAEGPRTRQLHV